MEINIHSKSHQLLENLANSIHDRDPKTPNPLFFSINEIHLVEAWLRGIFEEIKKDCVCL